MNTYISTVDSIEVISTISRLMYASNPSPRYDIEKDGDTITITPHKALTFRERQKLALQILANHDSWTKFSVVGTTTLCVTNPGKGHSRVGYAICRDDDRYDVNIGKAIAYERARFGNVIHEDLLGKE